MKFDNLPSQIASYIKTEIQKGRWQEWLPGERSLAELLKVSRRSLSSAMLQLRSEGVIRPEKGKGNRILTPSYSLHTDKQISVGLITPAPLENMRPGTTLWVHALQVLLNENGGHLSLFSGQKFFSKHPSNALKRHVSSTPHKCWVLAQSTHEAQAWFEDQLVPCVLAGTRHPGIQLPDVDFDAHALCYHAANTALSLGHRRIALLLTERKGFVASEIEAEAGFRLAFEQKGLSDTTPIVTWHQRSPEYLARTLRRLYSSSLPPSALLVTHGLDYLTTISTLTQLGLSIPTDVSVLSRNDDTFLDALFPTPTRYHCDPQLQAGRLYRLIEAVVQKTRITHPHIRIEPSFIRGASLASPKQ